MRTVDRYNLDWMEDAKAMELYRFDRHTMSSVHDKLAHFLTHTFHGQDLNRALQDLNRALQDLNIARQDLNIALQDLNRA